MTSGLVTVKFFVHLRLCVFSPQTGSETIQVAEREVIVASTNQSERQLASAKSKDKASSLRSKSRSPHRKHTPTSNSPVSQLGTPTQSIHKPSKSSPLVGRPRAKPSRRPHTSAGPRDASNLQFPSEIELKERNIRPGDHIFLSTSPLPKKTSSTRPMSRDFHTCTVIHHDGSNHVILQQVSLDHVRDWEEELARIEVRSRTSSADMLRFRKR